MTTYLVTAIVQDNRENTMKVCARCEDTFEAGEAILKELATRGAATSRASWPHTLDVVRETWAIHSLFIGEEPELPLF